MRILAIETVGHSGSVAALESDALVAERALASGQRSARSLAPAIADLLAAVGWQPRDVQLVAVGSGPGSFTGLRIGVTTAKTFAYAVGCEAAGVHSLAAIAWRAPCDVARLSVVLDAQRGELYAGEFSRAGEQLLETGPTSIVPAEQWLETLAVGSTVTGSGVEGLIARLPSGVTALDRSLWTPSATAVGQLAWQRYVGGERTSVFDLVPRYYRRAAAEEKLAGRPEAGGRRLEEGSG